jgi:diguanylate cyclase (GGDEF)-like protein
MAERELGKAGFRVKTALDAGEALEILKNTEIDLILCDIRMPEMDGFQFREQTLKQRNMPNIPFIFISAYDEPVNQITGFQLEIDDFIPKPVDPDVLIARIHAAVKRWKSFIEKISTDKLTGLLSRQYIENQIKKELERIERSGKNISVVFIDLDDFKNINDVYGHQTGDLVLAQFARLINQELRKIDFAGRYGGEEFLLLLVDADKNLASQISLRLLALFRNLPVGAQQIHCSFSAGIASAPEDGMDCETLIKKADEMMYQSKKGGKSRITASFRKIQ